MAMKNCLCKKFWPHFEKQNGRHSYLFENHKGALNLEIASFNKFAQKLYG